MTKEEWDALRWQDQETMIRDELGTVFDPVGVETIMTHPSKLASPRWSSYRMSGKEALMRGVGWDFYNAVTMMAGGAW